MIEYAYTARKNYRPRRIAKIESVNSVKKKDYFKSNIQIHLPRTKRRI